MGTRLAIHDDIPRLQEMLAAMGQRLSEAAIHERIDDPRSIVMLRETDGKVDGFCFSRSLSAEDATFGPMDVETDDVAVWLLGVIEIAFSMAWVPSVVGNVDNQVLHFTIWPNRPGLRSYVKGRFMVKEHKKAKKWRRQDGDAYEVAEDGAWVFHIRRSALIEMAMRLRS